MPLDPSILAQGKPFQTPDPLQNYAKVLQIQTAQNQNALAQYQLGTAKRGEEGQNALSRAQQAAYDPETGTYDMNKLRESMISGGFGALLPDVEKKMGELRAQQLTQQKTEGEIVNGRTKQFRDLLANVNNPSAAAQWLQAQYKDPFLKPVVSRMPLDQALAEIPTDPVKFNDWRNKNALGMEEFIKQNKLVTFETGTGQVKQRMSMPGLGGEATVVPGSTMQQVATPGEVMTNARMREKMVQDERHFQAQQANPGKEIKETDQGLFAIDKKTGAATPVTLEGKPLQAGKPLTEAQGKATGFALRAKEAHNILGNINYSPSAISSKQALEGTPLIGGPLGAGFNVMLPQQAQQADQAQRSFVNAILRQESGAAISESEFQNARKQYFPQPGDGNTVIEQKKKNRETAIRALEIASGPGIKRTESVTPTAPAAGGGNWKDL
jgi:hypothetical protein